MTTQLPLPLVNTAEQVQVVLIGISGCSSAGKTTIAHLLSTVFAPHILHILHVDDFCKEFDDLPIVDGHLDADGPDSVDFLRLVTVLDYIKTHSGNLPDDHVSWQKDVFPGQDEKALAMVEPALIVDLREKVMVSIQGIYGHEHLPLPNLVILEGNMMYSIPSVHSRLDTKLFIGLTRGSAKYRRMNRQGYGAEARPEEFWKSEEYFEKTVWRNYVKQHAHFFLDGDADWCHVNEEAFAKAGVQALGGFPDCGVGETLIWAVEEILQLLGGIAQLSHGD